MNDEQYGYDDEQYGYDDDEYAYEGEPAGGGRRRIWIAIGIVAALLLICVCVICITAGVIAYLNLGGSTEPTATAAPPPLPKEQVMNTSWLWTHLFETQPDSQSVVPNPENYLLVFWPNGQFQLKADCNYGAGSYTISGNSMTLFPGAITLAECGPDSLANQYLALLSAVSTWTIADGQLRLNLENNVGQMVFTNGGPAEPAPPATPTSTPTPPPAEPTPTPEAPPPAPTTDPAGGLIGPVWKWSELAEGSPPSQSAVPNPQNYTLTFAGDATFAIQADCNTGGGTYLLQNDSVMLELGPLSMIDCGPDSLSNQYVELLGTVVRFGIDGGRLLLYQSDGVSYLGFVP